MAGDKPAKPAVTLKSDELASMSKSERIKVASRGLYYVSDGRQEPYPFADEVLALRKGERPTLSNTAKELSKFLASTGNKNATRGAGRAAITSL